MSLPSTPVLVVAVLAVAGGLAAVVQRRRLLASWSFCGGMLLLAAEAALGDLARGAESAVAQAEWYRLRLLVGSLLPVCWLCFSSVYSRGDTAERFRKELWILALALVLPVGLASAFWSGLVAIGVGEVSGSHVLIGLLPGRLLTILLLITAVVVLINLERTFRSSVGTARWRIKYVFIGVALIFGVKVYTLSQTLLFSVVNVELVTVESGALFLACLLFAVAYFREGFSDLDIYPSRTVLQNSITVVLAGGYLIVVGILAQVVAMLGGFSAFPAQAFLVLVALVGLAVLLLSDRLRSRLHQFVTRHFQRPEHDYRKVWNEVTEALSSQVDRAGVCGAAARIISETFEVLAVTVYVHAEHSDCFEAAGTTAPEGDGEPAAPVISDQRILDALRAASGPIDIDVHREEWCATLQLLIPSNFEHGGNRIVVPIKGGGRLVGMISLVDRVNGVPYSREELQLAGAIADHLAASLLNLRLNEDLLRAKELEAFQTVSTFFVHDMKNAANSLNLMLQNLPTHFANPEFRQDALRAIAKTVDRINELTGRLSSLRKRLEVHKEEGDLNALVSETLEDLPERESVEVQSSLGDLPPLRFDREQIRTVITNLVTNAQDAVDAHGTVWVETRRQNGAAVLTVRDTGCGMKSEFIRNELFRPFRSTKSKGLGIGMFQSRMIVEAHQGDLQVESEPGLGSTLRVRLPLE